MDLNPPPSLSPPDSDAARRDADIVARLEQGDGAAAFERLVARYEGKVHRLCMALLRDEAQARDAAQDVFLRVWRALGTYDRRSAAPSTWLYAIARNRCLSLLARRDPDHASLSVPEVWAEAEAQAAPPDIVGEGPAALLARLVDALPVAYRSCLTLFYYEDRSVAEVAQMLGLPDGTVKTHLHRARKLLLAEFQRRGLDEPGLWL
ncbi:MAG: sigma-70 family RNA polymerase sigma factor [Proteobacteria bacterium]|nr:sigma-70 family RNA polymerase sigma factor [Pseudomonadota bacterium]